MLKTGMVTGTFDPITTGHLDLINRASKLFDKLYIVLLINPEKVALFSSNERLEMIKLATKDIANIEVLAYDGLAIDIAKEKNVSHFVRGIRDEKDFEYEIEMRDWNFQHGAIETIFLISNLNMVDVSSTKAKKMMKANDFSLLPDEIKQYVKTILR